jgi:hypothetical protein
MHTDRHFRPQISVEKFMKDSLKQHIIGVCNQKIAKKGLTVGISFYAFFANKNNNPQLLMEVAEWWIITHQLDHFEKAVKIKKLIQNSD